MIKWQEIKDLHVIAKLEELLVSWFGVEVLFADTNHKVRSMQLERTYEFKNPLLSLQMSLPYGPEYLSQDIERIGDTLREGEAQTIIFDSFFPHVKGVASKVVVDGEYLGLVFAFPFVTEGISDAEIAELKGKFLEVGVKEEDLERALNDLAKIARKEVHYLKDLSELVADEIYTFNREISKREERIRELNSELGDKYRYHSMIGKSKKMQMVYRLLEKISSSDSSCFIQGENGTGKELVAKAIHFGGPRKERMFLAVNCSAFNDNLLDSELFGHVKGAFTGAVKDKKGLFEQAHGGTLFLDEIGDTSLSMQVKLLRVLQEKTFLPVGASSPKRADVRIIAATNRDIKRMMAEGEFREDLFYRINVININLPSLHERTEDIPLLVEHFLEKRCKDSAIAKKTLSKRTLEKMLDYHWPGNVRELENEIERLVVLAGDEKIITPNLLSPRIAQHGEDISVRASHGINTSGSLKKALEELEALMIKEGLRRCNFNKSKVSKELGISRASLISKVEKYALDKRNEKKSA